jgi:UDP:flavonoid glycosyltransferase YjiC (YdhE family)
MKFLLIPGNNSLSHVAKCLAVETELLKRGHAVRIAVAKKHAPFLDALGKAHAVLPDIQEADDGPAPAWEWFRCVGRIQACIQAEIDLIKSYRPDRVLGVFRFTTRMAAEALGVAYDTLVCGCMLPDHGEVLGFAPGDPGAARQAEYLDNFFRFAGRKISRAAACFGTASVDDARSLLEGWRTFLWDFPEFMPLPHQAHRHHVGPLRWDGWPGAAPVDSPRIAPHRPLALISFGTCCASRPAAQKLVDCLLDQEYQVLMAAGGQADLMQVSASNGRLTVWPFAPLRPLIAQAALVVSHGGQMTLFEALEQGVPVAVMPFQPEQAHNGVCLERLGCGRRLVPAVAYKGDSQVYMDALAAQDAAQVMESIQTLTCHPDTPSHLARTRSMLGNYPGAARLAELLEHP